MCQRPNSAEVTRLARHGPHSRSADPSRTPRKANSSGTDVSSRIDTPSSQSSRAPLIRARASCRKPLVAGRAAATIRTSRTTPAAAAPYRAPAGMSAGSSARSARVAPANLAIRARITVSRTTETQSYPGGPSSPSDRATLNSPRTTTAATKQRLARIRHSRQPPPAIPSSAVGDASQSRRGRCFTRLYPRARRKVDEDRHRAGRPGPAVAFGPDDRRGPGPERQDRGAGDRAASRRAHQFAGGSIGPKVEAAVRFVTKTGNRAAIGALADIPGIVAGRAGTNVIVRSDLRTTVPAPSGGGVTAVTAGTETGEATPRRTWNPARRGPGPMAGAG